MTPESRIIASDDPKSKWYRLFAYARVVARFIPQILQIVCLIGFIPLMVSLTPYIDGSKELETAFTTSQLTALLEMLALCYGVMLIGKMGRR